MHWRAVFVRCVFSCLIPTACTPAKNPCQAVLCCEVQLLSEAGKAFHRFDILLRVDMCCKHTAADSLPWRLPGLRLSVPLSVICARDYHHQYNRRPLLRPMSLFTLATGL